MTRPVFLAPPDSLSAGVIVLDGAEGRHAAVVRRIAVGEEIDLTDGAGTSVTCVVTEVGKASLTATVTDRRIVPPQNPRIVVAQAVPKGDRGETAVETLTEVGVDVILPWSADRSMVRWKGERRDKQLARWRSTAREAAKQSRRAWLPEVTDPVDTGALVERSAIAALTIVLHEEAPTPVTAIEVPPEGDVVLVVGPEGGISPEETTALAAAGAVLAHLGPTVLRTSTAGTVAAGVVLSRTARWSTSAD